MGYYTYTAKADGYVAIEQNCYVGLCTLSDRDQTSLDLIMDADSFMAVHKHDKNDEYLFVIHGEVLETVSNKTYTIGQSISIPRGVKHGWKSKDGCKMKVIFKPKMK